MVVRLLITGVFLAVSLLAGCAANDYSDDPLLRPPQLIEVEKEEKS